MHNAACRTAWLHRVMFFSTVIVNNLEKEEHLIQTRSQLYPVRKQHSHLQSLGHLDRYFIDLILTVA